MADQPSLIPSAWAANNSTTETIPATTTESGKASWDQGFPVETSLPLSEGGIPPKYGDFNGVLNVLSQFCLFAQAGGQYAWSNTLDYSVGSIVLGTDGSIYRAAQVSGPSTAAVNPVGDTSGKWERIVSQSDIDALEGDIQDAMDAASDAASNASAAQSAITTLDANVVKLSGAQTVGGAKTFTSNPKIQNNYPIFAIDKANDTQNANPSDIRFTINGDNEAVIRLTNSKTLIIGNKSGTDAWSNGAQVTLENGGDFTCRAQNANTGTALRGKPDGTLTWGGNNIITDRGDKTIKGSLHLEKYNPYLFFNETDWKKGTPQSSGTSYAGINFTGSDGEFGGCVLFHYGQNKNSQLDFVTYKMNAATDTAQFHVYHEFQAGGTMAVYPSDSNVQLGYGNGSNRWKQLFATTTTISTSDERLKTSIMDVPDAVLDAWGEVNWKQFQMRDAVEEKGVSARLHNGLIAQRIDEVFNAHGLDASRYGLFCHDEWEERPEECDKDGNVIRQAEPAGDMYSLRYEEALCMEAAYQRRRADRAEARITSLERRLDEMEAVLASLISPVGDETYAEPEQEQDAEQEGEE